MLRPIKPPVKPLRIPLAAALLLCYATLGAADTKPLTLVLEGVNADTIERAVSNSTVISFSAGNAVITDDQTGTQTFLLEDIDNIHFDGEIASVNETELSFDSGVTIKAKNGIVTIEPSENIPFAYAAYSYEGRMAYQGQSATAVNLDFTALTAGVYVIVANEKVLKFINR